MAKFSRIFLTLLGFPAQNDETKKGPKSLNFFTRETD